MMDKETIIEALKLAKFKKDDVFYDLGCGNGQVLIEAAKMGAKATGFEISPYYYLLGQIRILFFKVFNINRSSVKSHIEVRFKNILDRDLDLAKADVVYCYLLPRLLNQINFHKGNRVISISFPIRKLKPIKTEIFKSHLIFIYSLSSRSVWRERSRFLSSSRRS
jgi:SAM-dependent methyltransferase